MLAGRVAIWLTVGALACLPDGRLQGGEAGRTQRVVGWRGDLSGRYPDATPPVVWGRWPSCPLRGLLTQAKKTRGEPGPDSRPLEENLIKEWLAIGPFTASEKPLDQECLPNEAAIEPDEGEKTGELAWKALAVKRKGEDFGRTELDWVYLEPVLPKKNQIAYAHVYLHSRMEGKLVFVLDHVGAFKAWVNSKVVYSNPKPSVSLWAVNNISWALSVHLVLPFEVAARRITVDVAKGWNRLLVKTTGNFHLRLAAEPTVSYEEKNIVWVTKLPDRSNASPIVVGNRIFLCSEPDELLCVDKRDGRVLWRRSNSFYDATSDAEKGKNPDLEEKVAPLVDRLKATEDAAEKLRLRKQIGESLVAVDKANYEMKVEGHTVSHWPIAGWCTPTPTSDGQLVYVWFTHGVAACYDLDGNRKWIQRVDLLLKDPKVKFGPYRYPCSPLLVDDKLVIGVPAEGVVALDAADGSLAWKQPEVKGCLVSMSHGSVNGTPVVFSTRGDAIRASDGKLLWPQKLEGNIDGPIFENGVLYLGLYGFSDLLFCDFSKAQGDSFAPVVGRKEMPGVDTKEVYASPLLHEGLLYTLTAHGVLNVIDVGAKAIVYKQQLDLTPMFHYNACGVASSPTLGGKFIYCMDNQGNVVVVQPGRQFRQVARNQLQTLVHRDFPLSPQETTAYSNPVFEGSRLYVRGEQHLYCIGER